MSRYLIFILFILFSSCHSDVKRSRQLNKLEEALLKHFFNRTDEKLIEKFEFRDSVYIQSLNTIFYDIDFDGNFPVWLIWDKYNDNLYIYYNMDNKTTVSFPRKILLAEMQSIDLNDEISVYNLFMSNYFNEAILLNQIVFNYSDSLRKNMPREGIDSLVYCILTNPNHYIIDLQLSDTSLVTEDTIKKVMSEYELLKYPIKEHTKMRIQDCAASIENKLIHYLNSNKLITIYISGVGFTAVTINYDSVYNQYMFDLYLISKDI